MRHAAASVYPPSVTVLLLLVAHVDFEFLAQLGTASFLVLKLPAIRERRAAKKQEAKKHSAQVRKVTDVTAGTKRAYKLDCSHDDHKPFGLEGDDHVKVNDPLREEH